MLPAVVLMSSTLLCIRVYVGRFDEDVSPPGAAGVSPFDSFSFDCLMVDGAERYLIAARCPHFGSTAMPIDELGRRAACCMYWTAGDLFAFLPLSGVI